MWSEITADHTGPEVSNRTGHAFQMVPKQALRAGSAPTMLTGALEEWVDGKSQAREVTLLLTVGLFQTRGLLLHSGGEASGDSFFGRVSPPPLCPLHPTHRRARGAVGRDLILLWAALLLSHGAKAILHGPDQKGVQVSILARGHLDD